MARLIDQKVVATVLQFAHTDQEGIVTIFFCFNRLGVAYNQDE